MDHRNIRRKDEGTKFPANVYWKVLIDISINVPK